MYNEMLIDLLKELSNVLYYHTQEFKNFGNNVIEFNTCKNMLFYHLKDYQTKAFYLCERGLVETDEFYIFLTLSTDVFKEENDKLLRYYSKTE